MFLGHQNRKEIITRIIRKGGGKFLKAISSEEVVHNNTDPCECPVCHKPSGLKGTSWAITNNASRPVFEDRFDTERCADHAIGWIGILLEAFRNYLGPKDEATELTEDELRDPITPEEEETDTEFNERFMGHVQRLEEMLPRFAHGEDRIEDRE